MSLDVRSMTQEQAREFIHQLTVADLKQIALSSLLGGAAIRAATGIPGRIRQQIAAGKERRRAEQVPPTEFELPKVASYSWPAQYYPAALAAFLVPPMAGYAAMNHLIKSRKRRADDAERAAAEKLFEDALRLERESLVSRKRASVSVEDVERQFSEALADEPTTKFAKALDELATKWAAGELTGILKAATNISQATPGVALSFAALAALLGSYVGWRMRGKSDNQKQIEAYNADKYRRQLSRPEAPQAVKYAFVPKLMSGLKTIRPLAESLGSTVLGGMGLSYAAANTDFGRQFMAARSAEALSDPKFMQAQLDNLFKNPEVMRQLYARMMPAMKQQFLAQHPRLGRLYNTFAA